KTRNWPTVEKTRIGQSNDISCAFALLWANFMFSWQDYVQKSNALNTARFLLRGASCIFRGSLCSTVYRVSSWSLNSKRAFRYFGCGSAALSIFVANTTFFED
ncbi:MAG: hypothetical protein M1457_08015, partial [bacterium]|nr:hypothetical protein [bacterium]